MAPLVGIVMGSSSDKEVMKEASLLLEQLGVSYEERILSAHRNPEEVREYALNAEERGVEVIIAGAGMAAHLAGAIAALSSLPVIGVPLVAGELKGLDALLSTVQMPRGVPVATVAIGGVKNAAILAAQILGLKYPEVRQKVKEYKANLAKG
jgi:5-(carboxyamino)imidazole ribonucleotide mutase